MSKSAKKLNNQIDLSSALLIFCFLTSTKIYANSVLVVPNGTTIPTPFTLTQNPGAPPPYNSVDVQANGEVSGNGNAVNIIFDQGNHQFITVQTEGSAAPGFVGTGTNTSIFTITNPSADPAAIFYAVNSGGMIANGPFLVTPTPVPIRFYNIASTTFEEIPARLQCTSINLSSSNGSAIYFQLGVNAAIPQDTLPIPPFRNPTYIFPFPSGPPLPLGSGGINADGVTQVFPNPSFFSPLATYPQTTIFVQGTFNLQLGLSGTAGFSNAGTIRVNTYAGSPGFTISSALASNAIPLNIFSQEGGITTITNTGSLFTNIYNGTGGTFTINNGGAFTAATINNYSGATFNATILNNVGVLNDLGGTFNIGTLNNSGTANVNAGSFNVITLANTGTFNLREGFSINGSNFSNTGTFNVFSNGTLAEVSGNALTNNNILNLFSGGTITGVAGSRLVDNGTLNIYGGTIPIPITSSNANSVININGNFATSNSISNIGTININNGGTLTLNNNIGARTLNNSGTLIPNSHTLTGNYIQTASGAINTTIQSGTPFYNQFFVTGTGSVSGTINVNYTNNGLGIADQQTYDIIITNGLLYNNPSVNSPFNPFLTFILDKDPGTPPNNVRIKAVRSSGSQITGNNPTINGVADTLSYLMGHAGQFPQFIPLLSKFFNVNQSTIITQLTELIPIINGMEIIPSLYGPYPLFDKIAKRLDALRIVSNSAFGNGSHGSDLDSGYAAGDMIGSHASFGPIFFGNAISQGPIINLDGYNAITTGVAVVADVPLNLFSKIGAGLSYSHTGGKSTGFHNTCSIDNYQFLVYGSLDYFEYLFIDGVASIARNHYRTKRNVSFMGLIPQANFSGSQSSAKGRAGLDFRVWNFGITPLATIQYNKVNQNKYTEFGGGITNLRVNPNHVTAVQASYGIKFSEVSNPNVLVPEIHVMALRYFKKKNPAVIITSEFVEGGPAFVAIAPQFPKTGTNVGGSLTARITDCMFFMAGVDLEFRNHFNTQSFSLKFRMKF